MSALTRLGRFTFTHKWFVVSTWIVVAIIIALLAVKFSGPTSNSLAIPGTQAQQTLDRYNELFPDAGSQAGRIVLQAKDGTTLADYSETIQSITSQIAEVNEVTTTISPFQNPAAISSDGTIGYITAQLKPATEAFDPISLQKVSDIVAATQANGLTAYLSGDFQNNAPGEIIGAGEIVGVGIALIVLVITLGSLVAAGLPILIAIVTVGLSMAGLFSLSQLIDINATTPALAVMLGLAVGIDYSLFIINRYRSFILEGYSSVDAAGKAIATAGNAVLFAAATVVIALAALTVVNIPFITTMGLAGAGTVALAALISVTLIPALLGFVGLRLFSRKTRALAVAAQHTGVTHNEHSHTASIWHRFGAILLKYPKRILVTAVLVLLIIAAPVLHLTLGLPSAQYAADDSTERKAYELTADGFGAGANGPLLLVVEGLPAVTNTARDQVRQQILSSPEAQAAQAQLAASVASLPAAQLQMLQAQQVAALNAQVEQYAPFVALNTLAQSIAERDDVASAQPAFTRDNGTIGVIQVIPETGPTDTQTIALVKSLRDTSTQQEISGSDTVSFGVTGTTAAQIDINAKLAAALPVYLVVVVGLSFILLLIAFRSILIPIKATVGFLLSVLAMFGALVAVFQWGWFGITDAPGPITSFIPIIATGILFGLAMDYEFFLVSGMQEAYHHKKDARRAVLRGFSLGSKVVTAAGAIMVAVFAGFISNHDATIQAIGFALAIGILVDAFVVRLIIVPVVMRLLGGSAWYIPKWLDRILPKLSIEGDAGN